MQSAADTAKEERLRRERDLYRALLELAAATEVEPFLQRALVLCTSAAGAEEGYVEVFDPDDDEHRVGWSATPELSAEEVDEMRGAISRGVIAEAVATGQSVVTASARSDERFKNRTSVKRSKIQAVLCVPIGRDPPLGVLYLQGRAEPGPFDDEDKNRTEFCARHLAPMVDQLLIRRRFERSADHTIEVRKRLTTNGFIGTGDAAAQLLDQLAMVSRLDVSVLLTGATGTGKTHVARIIHDNSPRRSGPFVEVNCAALPENLLESELFGAKAGAHSTARAPVTGKVAAAEHGTLFLDEIGELPLSGQSKLLQLLQSKTYYPLGAAEPANANVRIVAATNTDLEAAVVEKRFREDLFYRLQVVPIRVPSLAERRRDVAALAKYFCERAARAHDLPSVTLSPGALHAIQNAEWPGNVRQLSHAVEAATIRAASGGVGQVEVHHLFPEERATTDRPGPVIERGVTLQEGTRRYQRALVESTLEANGWNVAAAAREIDVSRAHIYNLIKAFGLSRSTSDSS